MSLFLEVFDETSRSAAFGNGIEFSVFPGYNACFVHGVGIP